MARRGRVFLQTDSGREIDRTVDSDVRLVYYPTSSQSDLPIVVRMFHRDGRVHVSVGQDRPDGTTEPLGSFSRDAQKGS